MIKKTLMTYKMPTFIQQLMKQDHQIQTTRTSFSYFPSTYQLIPKSRFHKLLSLSILKSRTSLFKRKNRLWLVKNFISQRQRYCRSWLFHGHSVDVKFKNKITEHSKFLKKALKNLPCSRWQSNNVHNTVPWKSLKIKI